MKFCFVEEVSSRLTHQSDDEMLSLVSDGSIFVFRLMDQSARNRSAQMNLVLQLKRIFILFAFSQVAKN
jgi:hypothetical protein